MKKVILILIILLWVSFCYSAKVDRVVIKGNKRVNFNRISDLLVNEHEEFELSKVDESIKKLFNTGLFLNVDVELEVENSEIILVYNLTEKPFISGVYFEGNSEISEEKLLEKISLKSNQPLDKKQIEAAVKTIRDKYEEENFYNVKISYDIEEKGNNSADIIFSIEEGKEAKVRQINFLGNSFYKDKELKRIIETDTKGFFSWLTGSGNLKSDELEMDRERIRSLYLNNGFMKVRVGEPEIRFNEKKTDVTLNFRVDEGSRYKINNVSFEGNEHVKSEKLESILILKKDEFFSSEKYQRDIAGLTDVFTEIGYAYANVEPDIVFDDDNKTVSVTYKIEENILVYVVRIEITGNEKTRDRILRREFDIVEGELYNSKKIRESKQHIQYLNFFDEVTLSEDKIADNRLKLKLNVKEKSTGTFSIGAGYSTLDGFVGTIQIQKDNIFGLGYALDLKTEFSNKRTDYTLSFTNSWLFDRPITFGFDLFNLDRSYYDYSKRSKGGAIRVGHPVIKRKLYMYYRFAYEDDKIYEIDDNASVYVKDQAGKTTTISFTPSLVYNTTNHPVIPTRGNKSKIYSKYAGGVLGGDNDYIKSGVESSQYFPLFWGMTGMMHGEIGFITATGDKELPVDERFRLGGMYSVRGFKYGDISPKDSDGNDYGGDKYVLFNIESVFPISEAANLMGVVFVDMGQVYDNNEEYFSYDIRKSYGFGFRWYSPVGPLRLEYGRKFEPKPGESPDRWDFSIGGMF